MQATPSVETPPAGRTSDRSPRIAAGTLLLASLLFAGAAATSLPSTPNFEDAAGVFCAGFVPGLLVILLLWFARPDLFPRRVRQSLVAVSLFGAGLVAVLPLVLRAI